MKPLHAERLTAQLDGDFVVFLIGMRINRPWRLDKWWSVSTAMPRMIGELRRRPELGLLHHELWVGRTFLVLQYWRSLEQLLDYATNRDAAHLPAWRAFNRAVGTDGSVGIWHETYCVVRRPLRDRLRQHARLRSRPRRHAAARDRRPPIRRRPARASRAGGRPGVDDAGRRIDGLTRSARGPRCCS